MMRALLKEVVASPWTSGIVTALLLVLTPFVTNHSHVLLVGAWICSTLLAYEIATPRLRFQYRAFLTIFLAVIFGIVFWKCNTQIKTWRVEDRNASDSGILYPSKDLVITSGQKISRVLYIGDCEVPWNIEDSTGSALATAFGASQLVVEESGGRLFVSTEIRGPDGQILGQLRRNEWTTPQVGGRIWDRNYSDNAIEILDDQRDVVLQIRLYSERIRLQGKWYHSPGRRTIAISPERHPGDARFSIGISDAEARSPENSITPMFRYPSAEHLGKLAYKPVSIKREDEMYKRGNLVVQTYIVHVDEVLPELSITVQGRSLQSIAAFDWETGNRVAFVKKKGSSGQITLKLTNIRGRHKLEASSSGNDILAVFHKP